MSVKAAYLDTELRIAGSKSYIASTDNVDAKSEGNAVDGSDDRTQASSRSGYGLLEVTN